jgi:hypothetical protein
VTEPFVNQLRTRGEVIELASPGGPAITVRVEVPEVWDVVRVHASPDERMLLIKLHGWEVLDENASLAATGAVDGSIFVLTHRRRRPVR